MPEPQTYIGAYTRDGFAGLRSSIVRQQYTAPFAKVNGGYALVASTSSTCRRPTSNKQKAYR